jgi:peptide deformylase
LLKLIYAGNPILKMKAKPVETFDKDLKYFIGEMKKELYAADGVGLAAPQVSVSKRIFVADDGKSGFEAYINPEWKPIGDEKNVDTEGCLSVPDWYGEVERYSNVLIRYQDIHGKKKVKKASGLLARCIQHETDHLNGILFIEKAISLHKGPNANE